MNSDSSPNLNNVKVLEAKAEVFYTVYLGDLTAEDTLDSLSTTLTDFFPKTNISVKIGDSGLVVIRYSVDSASDLKDRSEQLLDLVKKTLKRVEVLKKGA
jgi:urease accessory protein UreH